jgi:hypothetical protein
VDHLGCITRKFFIFQIMGSEVEEVTKSYTQDKNLVQNFDEETS